MLSVNYISNFLADKQVNIDNTYYKKLNDFERNKNIQDSFKLDKFQSKLPDSFNILFNKSISDFYYDSKLYKNKSSIFTLFNSIFLIGSEYFNINNENDKENYIKEFIKNMDNDIFQKDLYHKFNYVKNRHFNKSDIQMVLKNAYQFKSCDKLSLLKQYLADYLGINLYIFSVENSLINFSKCETYITSYYGDIKNKFTPNFIMIHENEIYKPVLNSKSIENSSSVVLYSEYPELIDNIWNYFKIVNEINEISQDKTNIKDENESTIESNPKYSKYNLTELVKLKIDDIKKLCIENNIELQKKSDKTMKMINKIKNDLINDLLKI
jgi:hypothetical protein